jgi:alkylation response protein AidB-like acyl-CoA dehydrogenase
VDATAKHLTESTLENTGTKLRDFPNLRARLAQMSVRTEQCRSLLGRALNEVEHATPTAPLLVLESRLGSLDAALEVTDAAMKCCGGAAFSKHLPLERIFRDARAGWVMAPTVDHLNDFVGRSLTGMPLFG